MTAFDADTDVHKGAQDASARGCHGIRINDVAAVALVTLCIGGGQGIAAIFARV